MLQARQTKLWKRTTEPKLHTINILHKKNKKKSKSLIGKSKIKHMNRKSTFKHVIKPLKKISYQKCEKKYRIRLRELTLKTECLMLNSKGKKFCPNLWEKGQRTELKKVEVSHKIHLAIFVLLFTVVFKWNSECVCVCDIEASPSFWLKEKR